MRSIPARRFLWFTTLLLALGAGVSAESHPSLPAPSLGGVRIGLSTSGYRFEQPLTVNPHFPRREERDSFFVSAAVTNGSRVSIPFTFPSVEAAAQRFVFRVFNSDGDEVWRSDAAAAGMPVATVDSLKAGKSWKRGLRVPLIINGQRLAAGRYSLEAALSSGDPLFASTMFEVAPNTRPAMAKISGVVWRTITDAGTPPLTWHGSQANAHVTITRVPRGDGSLSQLPVEWHATTGPDGRFEIETGPGQFKIRAVSYPDHLWFYSSDHGIGDVTGNVAFPLDADPTAIVVIRPPYVLPAFSEGSVKINVSAGETARPVVMIGTGADEKQLIHGLSEVKIEPITGDPQNVIVSARGVVPTGGWWQPALVSQELPADGFLHLDFVARPPGDVATLAFANIEARVKIPVLPGFVGVKVRSQNNSMSVARTLPVEDIIVRLPFAQ